VDVAQWRADLRCLRRASVGLLALGEYVPPAAASAGRHEPADDAGSSSPVLQQTPCSETVDRSAAVRGHEPEQDQEYFSDGLTEELIGLLTSFRTARAGPHLCFYFKSKQRRISDIARA